MPVMHPFEREIVVPQVKALQPRSVYMEIGSHDGGSAWYFGNMMEAGATIICVDVPGNRPKLLDTIKRLRDAGYTVELLAWRSQWIKTRDGVRAILDGRKIDVLLIDGDHDLPGVAVDADHYIPMVREGGLVIFHDAGSRITEVNLASARGHHYLPAVNAVWQYHAHGKRSLLVQAQSGTALVWV